MRDPTDRLRALLRRLFQAREVEWIETHISIVALVDDRAFKFKKPVDLGFLDFSTLESRRHFCEEELRLNRRLAPELYLGLVRVAGPEQAPTLDGDGEAIEYGVLMRRFDADQEMRAVVARGEADAALFEEFARELAEFHAGAARAESGDERGTFDRVGSVLRENFAHLTDGRFDGKLLGRLREWIDAELQSVRELIERRKAQGAVRECHGDLHLGNLVRIGGRIVAFDCLEFSEPLRWIDTSAEIAFLCMDLDHHGRRDLAFAFLNGYLEQSGDYQALGLLRLQLVARALVRAKVASLANDERGDDDVRAHLELARRYLAPTQPPTLWIAFGLSGSGKTTVSRMAARLLPAIRVRSDVERKRLAVTGDELYGDEMNRRTYERLASIARIAIGCGWSAMLDAAHLRREQRDAARRLADELGVALRILAVEAAPEALRERVARRLATGDDASDATPQILRQQIDRHDPLTADERRLAIRVDTTEPIGEQALRELLRRGSDGTRMAPFPGAPR